MPPRTLWYVIHENLASSRGSRVQGARNHGMSASK